MHRKMQTNEVISIGYSVTFQTEQKYKSIRYGQGTIYSSACGPASLCNALAAAGIAKVDLPAMCQLAVASGARVEGGTVLPPLLRAAGEKYHFSYTTTSKNAELLAHLQRGGVAILHAGDSYKLFSTSGHFVAAVAVSGQTITVLDSYWYSGKYTQSAIRRNYVSVLEKGVIHTSLTQCGKATIDRAPSYYLIAPDSIETSAQEEEDLMQYYNTLSDVPVWYHDAVKKLVDRGVLEGNGKELYLSEDLCRMMTILDRLGLIP